MSIITYPADTLYDAVLARGDLTETPMERMARETRERAAQALQEFVEDIEWMAHTGETSEGCAERRGVTLDAIRKRLATAGRLDLMDVFRRNEIERHGAPLGEIRQWDKTPRRVA
jgi:hypothetical protein